MENKYTLLISEKREVAEKLAKILNDSGNFIKHMEYGVDYFESVYKGRKLLIVPAAGHLYSISSERPDKFYYPVFNVNWVPSYLVKKEHKRSEKYLKIISKIAKRASEFISATDYDIEGEVIGYTILKYACDGKENQSKRMTFSTLTDQDLIESYEKLSPNLNFRLAEAGETRHIIDFLWGINLSRAMTLAAKKCSGKYSTISTGRVQGPTLKLLVDREKEIQSYVPSPFWEIKTRILIKGKSYDVEYEKKELKSLNEALRIINDCNGKEGYIEEVTTKNFIEPPPVPYNLNLLQKEAYDIFGFTPSQTLRIAENLYLKALISYPRTSSQKIPEKINCRNILISISKKSEYKNFINEILNKEIKPKNGDQDDPAHPAIYPTGIFSEKIIDWAEKKLFDLIIRRFLSIFSETALKETVNFLIKINKRNFHLKGTRFLNKGWLKIYGSLIRGRESHIPNFKKGELAKVSGMEYIEKYSTPPKRYNPSSLLNLMENRKIGTKATRSSIIDTLYDRAYIKEKNISVTELGFDVVEILGKYCPKILALDFTRKIELQMIKIEEGSYTKDQILIVAIKELKEILKQFKEREGEIGRDLSVSIKKGILEKRTIGLCPICKNGRLIILNSRKNGKRFVGCTNFRKNLCNAFFYLPQKPYIVNPSKKNCKYCQWPLVIIKTPKKSWNLCLNQECPSKR